MPAKVPTEERTASYKEQTALTNGLNTRHRDLMRELAGGATNAQAASRCNFSIGRVLQLKASELFARELMRMEDEIDEKVEDRIADDKSVSQTLKDASPLAATTLVTAATTGAMNSMRVASAKDLLDRTGHKAPTELIADVNIDVGEGLQHALDTYMKDKEKGERKEREDAV